MIVAGVDPGKGGAIALLSPAGAAVFDMPLVQVGKRREYDLAALRGIFESIPLDTLCAVEQVGTRPGEGAVGAFSFGTGFGLMLMGAAMRGLRLERVTPQRWRKAMLEGLPKGKGSSLQRARELFPACAAQLARVKDHGRADALLIAEYARRHLLGGHHDATESQHPYP